jgi:hypothetical protein
VHSPSSKAPAYSHLVRSSRRWHFHSRAPRKFTCRRSIRPQPQTHNRPKLQRGRQLRRANDHQRNIFPDLPQHIHANAARSVRDYVTTTLYPPPQLATCGQNFTLGEATLHSQTNHRTTRPGRLSSTASSATQPTSATRTTSPAPSPTRLTTTRSVFHLACTGLISRIRFIMVLMR